MVFATEAPRYWARGLSVIPVSGKRPVLEGWNQWALDLPDVETQNEWLTRFGGSGYGIGLVCGRVSGLCAIDIDSEDERVVAAIEQALPFSPWHRVGRRGKIMVYKYGDSRNFSIKDADGKSIVDVLSLKKQFVLPPSIHPDTGRPYYANCDLLDAVDRGEIGHLPNDVGAVIVAALRAVGIESVATRGEKVTSTTWVSAGNRDNSLLRLAGNYSKDVVDGKWPLVRMIEAIETWVTNFTEQNKIYGDNLEVDKAIDRLIYCLRRDVFEHGKTLPEGWDEGLDEEAKARLGISDIDDSRRRWSFKEIAERWSEKIVEDGLNDEGLLVDLVDTTLHQIANNTDLNATEEDRLLRLISDSTAGRYRIVSLRKRILEFRQGEVLGETHAEVANFIMQKAEVDGEIRWNDGYFWRWVGSHWTKIDDNEILSLIINETKGMKSVKKQGDYTGVFRVLQTLRCQPLGGSGSAKLAGLNGVNFVNGFLTEDLVLLEHDKDYGCTYCIDFPYDESLIDKALMFQNMLRDFWGKDVDFDQKVDGLQEAMAATLFGVATRYQRVFCFKGTAGAGKTRIIHLMEKLMPPGTTSTVPPEKFGEKFESTDLAGKLLNKAGELSRNKINGKLFKMIVEGSEIQGQFKNKPVFTYSPKAAHWFGSNVNPAVDDPDGGWSRRWLFFRFDHALDPAKRVAFYEDDVLREEKEAIMAWAVQGIRRLRANQEYTLSQSHFEASEDMNRSGDSVGFWLGRLMESERCRIGAAQHQTVATKSTSIEALYRVYRMFSTTTGGVSPVALSTFIERMEAHGQKLGFFPNRQPGGGVTGFLFFTLVVEGELSK